MLKDQINEKLSSLSTINRSDPSKIHHKLDELIEMLNDSDISNESVQEIYNKLENALKFYRPGRNPGADQLLFIDTLDKRSQRKTSVFRVLGIVLKITISLLLILLGFGMIIMPAPPYFEMFTLFYINRDDGITIMDVISLIVALIGIYLLISSLSKMRLN
jgi:hypothetical protein